LPNIASKTPAYFWGPERAHAGQEGHLLLARKTAMLYCVLPSHNVICYSLSSPTNLTRPCSSQAAACVYHLSPQNTARSS